MQQLLTDLRNPFPLRRFGRKKYKGTTPIEDTVNAVRYEQAGKALDDGNITKACKVIVEPSTQSPVTVESLEVLKLLHPKRLVGNDIVSQIIFKRKQVSMKFSTSVILKFHGNLYPIAGHQENRRV